MNAASVPLSDLIGALIGFTLTLFILSYMLGDNALFRLAAHIVVGVAAGYVIIVTVYNVLYPQLFLPFLEGNRSEIILRALYLLPAVLILLKISPRLSRLGNGALAMLVGTGAAAAIGGALFGNIFPQSNAAMNSFADAGLLSGSVLLIGTVTTLLYFHFGERATPSTGMPARLRQIVRWLGKLFIAVALGALFAGVYITALTALVERLTFLWQFLRDLALPSLLG